MLLFFVNNPSKFTSSMYKMKKTNDNSLIEDLIVTGGHSILVDKLTEEETEKTLKIWENLYRCAKY
jgi:glutamine amidotransferase PdxT